VLPKLFVIRKRSSESARAAKPAQGNDSQLVVRLPAALVRRVDQFAERMRNELPGTRFARAEAVRVLLTRALDQGVARPKP
jgi:hypothetical protein